MTTPLTPESIDLLERIWSLNGRSFPLATRDDLIRIEQAAVDAVLDVDRVAAALHRACEDGWKRRADELGYPSLNAVTMHGADAHHDRALDLIAALRGEHPIKAVTTTEGGTDHG